MGELVLPPGQKWFTMDDVASHNKPTDCWIVVQGNVINVTHFLPVHPGGKEILLSVAGTDPTVVWESIHSPGTIERHASQFIVGKIKGWVPPEPTEEVTQAIWIRNEVAGGPIWAFKQLIRYVCGIGQAEKDYARRLKATYGPREQRVDAPDEKNKERVAQRAAQASQALSAARRQGTA